MHKQTKATSIPPQVKSIVWRRDFGKCVICGSHYGGPHCHFIRRSQGGLGIEENIWTGCEKCHREFDSEAVDGPMHQYMEKYLKAWYPEWDKSKLVYQKYDWEAIRNGSV